MKISVLIREKKRKKKREPTRDRRSALSLCVFLITSGYVHESWPRVQISRLVLSRTGRACTLRLFHFPRTYSHSLCHALSHVRIIRGGHNAGQLHNYFDGWTAIESSSSASTARVWLSVHVRTSERRNEVSLVGARSVPSKFIVEHDELTVESNFISY